MSDKSKLPSGKAKRRGNIVDRMEEARARRAAVLGTSEVRTTQPANDPAPIKVDFTKPRKTHVTPRKVSVDPKQPTANTTDTAQPSPLVLKSPVPPKPVEPKPAAAIDPAPKPLAEEETAAKRPVAWHFAAILAIGALLATLLTLSPQPGPTVSSALPELPTPAVVTASTTRVPARTPFIKTDRPASLIEASVAEMPMAPVEATAPTVTVPSKSPTLSAPRVLDERPRRNPRREDAAIARVIPATLVAVQPDTAFSAPSPASLDVLLAVNVPAAIGPARLAEVEERLALLGLDTPRPKAFGFVIKKTHVRYYHEADKSKAQTLAEAFDGTARDFTGFSPIPPVGFVELWLRGQPPRTVKPKTSAFDGLRRDLRQIRTNITGAIRSISQ